MYGLFTLVERGAVVLIKEHVYLADLDRCRKVSEIPFEAYLLKEEKEQLNQITIPRSRNRAMLRRSLTRMIISSFLSCSPDTLRFCRNSYGKPYVLEPVTDLTFNLSHSENYLVLIADKNREIGIDIETAHSLQKRKYKNLEGIYSGKEFASYERLLPGEKYEMFCRTWVMKEAITKALSFGLTADLGEISLPVEEVSSDAIQSFECYGRVLKIQWIKREDYLIAIAYGEEII